MTVCPLVLHIFSLQNTLTLLLSLLQPATNCYRAYEGAELSGNPILSSVSCNWPNQMPHSPTFARQTDNGCPSVQALLIPIQGLSFDLLCPCHLQLLPVHVLLCFSLNPFQNDHPQNLAHMWSQRSSPAVCTLHPVDFGIELCWSCMIIRPVSNLPHVCIDLMHYGCLQT